MSKQFKIMIMNNATYKESPHEADTLAEAFQIVGELTTVDTQAYIFDVEAGLEYRIIQAQPFTGKPWVKE